MQKISLKLIIISIIMGIFMASVFAYMDYNDGEPFDLSRFTIHAIIFALLQIILDFFFSETPVKKE